MTEAEAEVDGKTQTYRPRSSPIFYFGHVTSVRASVSASGLYLQVEVWIGAQVLPANRIEYTQVEDTEPRNWTASKLFL